MRTIEYSVSYENMISRIPGLFAYLERDEFGETVLHPSYDSNCGCYGKIVQNIKLPEDCNLEVDGKNILEGGKTYTYRTIITYYYQYKDTFVSYVYRTNNEVVIPTEEYKKLDSRKQRKYERKVSSAFIRFVEKGIGKHEIPTEVYNILLTNSSQYVNICNENDIIDIPKDGYVLKENTNVPKFIYLANVISLYNELVKMGKQCKYYQEHKDRLGEDRHMCCLCERYTNMGGDGLRDYVGDLLQETKTISDEYKRYADNDNSLKLEFDIDLVSSYDDIGIMTSYVEEWIPYKKYYVGDRVFYDGSIWRCKEENNGVWNEEEMRVVFATYQEDGEIYECYFEKIDNSLENEIAITGQTDSKLKDLRRFVTYMNNDNVGEKPQDGYDWLFYYRKNNICNITTLNDDFGNILPLDNTTTIKDGDEDKLMAYGDVITDITANAEEHTITFEYVLGAHLIGDEHIEKVDEDRNHIHYWKKFNIEKGTGVKYLETYNYVEGSDLDKLVKGDFKLEEIETDFSFGDYVNGKYDNNLKSFKFEFVTFNNEINYNKTIANQEVNIISTLTDFEITKKDNDEFMEMYEDVDKEFVKDKDGKIVQKGIHMFRHDYFNGISYAPTRDIDVHIERGSTSCFQQHISFGEIKTLEDMTEFRNNSFFKIIEQ